MINRLPKHDAALYLQHNDHKNDYDSAQEWVENHYDLYEWESDEHKRRAIETDSIWTLQWYPDTPIGFHAIAAPTLDELIDFANQNEVSE